MNEGGTSTAILKGAIVNFLFIILLEMTMEQCDLQKKQKKKTLEQCIKLWL